MSRLYTIGFEGRYLPAAGSATDSLDQVSLGAASGVAPSVELTRVRSGSAALKCDSGAGNASAYFGFAGPIAASITTYTRVFFSFDALPSSTVPILSMGTVIWSVRLTAAGKVQLWNDAGAPAQIGSDSSATVVADGSSWYRLEVALTLNGSSQITNVELRLDGAVVASGAVTAILGSTHRCGWVSAPGASKVLYCDDVAINDSLGSDQASWPGDGKVVLLKPISDGQRGSWTGGAGGTTNLWDAVDNTPPIGTASETNSTQIENADTSPDNATDEYRPNLTTYTDAGVGASDTINVVQAFCNHGEDVATGTKTGKFRIESNPAQTAYDTFTFGDDVGALGTWPSNWKWKLGTPEYSPSPTLGASPQIALRKTDTGNRVGSVAFLGMYVDYTPAVSGSTYTKAGFGKEHG